MGLYMEKEKTESTTATDLLAAYKSLKSDEKTLDEAVSTGKLKALSGAFAASAFGDIARACHTDLEYDFADLLLASACTNHKAGSREINAIAKKRLALVDSLVGANRFELASDILTRSYANYVLNTPEARMVVQRGEELAEKFVAAGKYDLADNLLRRAYADHPSGSKEEAMMVGKRMEIVDGLISNRNFATAERLLKRAFGNYPTASKESIEVLDRLNQLRRIAMLDGTAPRPGIPGSKPE